METKHTKGEWEILKVDLSDYKQLCIGSNERKSLLAHIYLPDYKFTEEDEANAKLLAQSPSLLTDLNDAVSLLMKLQDVIPSELQETYGNLLINASVTIQKATE